MTRLFSILLLAACLSGCAVQKHEFDNEFWLKSDGSGSFTITAPPWVWNTVKNVGESTRVDSTVTEDAVAALFQEPAILKPRVRKTTRDGQTYLSVSADFVKVNALVGTRAFPDLVIALKPEGNHLKLFGVWRRPARSGTAQGDDTGAMAVRFHIPSEIISHRNASNGIERGNVLSWNQGLRGAIAGAPIDFAATIGTRTVLAARLGRFGGAILVALALGVAALLILSRGRQGKRRGRRSRPDGSDDDANFLNYDPSSGAK